MVLLPETFATAAAASHRSPGKDDDDIDNNQEVITETELCGIITIEGTFPTSAI